MNISGKALKTKEGRLYYGWVIVLVGFFISFLAYGVRYSFAVLFPSLLEEFKWSRDATAAILSFHLLAYGITAPIAGVLVERLKPRRSMGLGAVLLAAGAATSSLGSAPWHYYLSFGLLTGVGLCLMGAVPLTRIVANWFVDRRALALSVMNFGAGGAFLLYPVVAFLIERFGWRNTFLIEGAVVAGLLLPAVALFIYYQPEDKGLLPDSNRRPAARVGDNRKNRGVINNVPSDLSLGKAMEGYRFWALCFCAFAGWGVTQHILVTHHVAFARDMGYSQLYAAGVLALFGVFISFGNLAGFISDRIGREVTFSLGTFLGLLGIAALLLVKDASQPWLLYAYAVVYGFGYGLTMPTIAAAATDMFQGKGSGVIIGFVWFSFSMGGTIGPWLGGVIYETSGGYRPAFMVSAVMFLLACVSFWVAAPSRSGKAESSSQ